MSKLASTLLSAMLLTSPMGLSGSDPFQIPRASSKDPNEKRASKAKRAKRKAQKEARKRNRRK